MKLAATISRICHNVKTINVTFCWIDFIANILGVVAAVGTSFVGFILIDDEQQKYLVADYISQYLKVKSEHQNFYFE